MEIKNAFFHPFGNPEGLTLEHFFYVSHIRHNGSIKCILEGPPSGNLGRG